VALDEESVAMPNESVTAELLAQIAAQCAQLCGVEVRLTPLPEVRVRVGRDKIPPGTADDDPARFREVVCLGVRFDEEYVIVRWPRGKFGAFKVDASGRTVLRLQGGGSFRTNACRVFFALIWDRLKAHRGRYEPLLAQLPGATSAAAVLTAGADQVRSSELRPTRKSRKVQEGQPSAVPAAADLAAVVPAPGSSPPAAPAVGAPGPPPAASEGPSPVVTPPPSPSSPSPPSRPAAAPLARRRPTKVPGGGAG
jgi:hypothetical protein